MNPDNNADNLPEGGNDEDDIQALSVFNDTIEPGEQGKINGKETGQPRVTLTQLKKDKGAQSWLFEKYYNMTFVDKNPDADDEDVPPLEDETKWEHRRIQNIVWARRLGWTVESVIIGDTSGVVETYVIDTLLLRMIRESPHNTRQIKSLVGATPATPAPTRPDSSDDSDSNSHSDNVAVV